MPRLGQHGTAAGTLPAVGIVDDDHIRRSCWGVQDHQPARATSCRCGITAGFWDARRAGGAPGAQGGALPPCRGSYRNSRGQPCCWRTVSKGTPSSPGVEGRPRHSSSALLDGPLSPPTAAHGGTDRCAKTGRLAEARVRSVLRRYLAKRILGGDETANPSHRLGALTVSDTCCALLRKTAAS